MILNFLIPKDRKEAEIRYSPRPRWKFEMTYGQSRRQFYNRPLPSGWPEVFASIPIEISSHDLEY